MLNNQIYGFMTAKGKVILLVVLVAVIVGILIYNYASKEAVPGVGVTPAGESTPAAGEVPGINGLVDGLLGELSAEALVLNEEEGDASLMEADTTEFSDFGQTVWVIFSEN